MKNFMVRIWDGKNQQMIYPSESFHWTISLGGEVFRGTSAQPDCEIMPFSGVCDVEGNEIYEGDIVSFDYDGPKNGKSIVRFLNGQFFFFAQRTCMFPISKKDVSFFKIKVVDNVYEKAKRKAKK